MQIELRYFTGTGNSLRVLKTCGDVFVKNQHSVNLSEIKVHEQIDPADLIGFCFPVYAFGIPRICRNYLNSLKPFKNNQKVFVLITAGDRDESGFSVKEATRILKKKKCTVVYSGVIQMPINWTTSPVPPFPPKEEEAKLIIENGVTIAQNITLDILAGISKYHRFNYPKRFKKLKFFSDFILFKYLGVPNLWRTFKVYESCTGCGACKRICPTRSITMIDKVPQWSSTCEQCMRCVNYCPSEAIYQIMGGETKGKIKYFEPDFIPMET